MGTDAILAEIKRLKPLVKELIRHDDVVDRVDILDQVSEVKNYFDQPGAIRTFTAGLTPLCELVVKSVVAIGQAPIVFRIPDTFPEPYKALRALLPLLIGTDRFYAEMGGIVGYQLAVLELLATKGKEEVSQDLSLHEPTGIELVADQVACQQAVRDGVEKLPELAELHPVGGAGDRLNLIEEGTGIPLPAGKLPFCGRSLIAGLIRDVQAREYLHYKLCGEQLCSPIAMMTSLEKNNHQHIENVLRQNRYFGRSEDSFFLFKQPLSPVITTDGNWSMRGPLQICMKPGGHGVMWKVAKNAGAFEWMEKQGRHRVLIRQVNNPIAGCDSGLLAFTGTGLSQEKSFGFASCPRRLNSAEGMNVLLQRSEGGKSSYCLTNVEYTDFAKWGVEDKPKEEGSEFSRFPSNTNILFADLKKLDPVIDAHPLPGMLLNMKSKTPFIDAEGKESACYGGRLESTMQNIADYLCSDQEEQGPSFLIYNSRRKTISVTKKAYKGEGEIWETPEGCFYEMMENARELLESCGFALPPQVNPELYIQSGPSFIFLYHPALGPLYQVITQKLRGGNISPGSELQLEIAECDIEGLHLDGSLVVQASAPLGGLNVDGQLRYGESAGKCRLKNVRVENRGIDRSEPQAWWKNRYKHHELCRVEIQGSGEFVAEDVILSGEQQILVPDKTRITAVQEGEGVRLIRESIDRPSWSWNYQFADDNAVVLLKQDCSTRSTKGQPSQLAS